MHSVLVDQREVGNFRRRAIRRYPLEYIECIWGYKKDGVFYICAFQPLKHKATRDYIEIESEHEPDYGERAASLTLMGTIHTHPDSECAPSLVDWESIQPGEQIMGIMSVTKERGRHYTEIRFFEAREPFALHYSKLRRN
jgi:proteasome lid subunit RPN8/RPN11